MKTYPLGYFGLVCIFTLTGFSCVLFHTSLGTKCFFLLACILTVKVGKIAPFSKKFLLSFGVSCIVGFFMIHAINRKVKGQFLRGNFQFEKVFRTSPGRLGGFGTLTLKDGSTLTNIYIHSRCAKNKTVDADQVYHFSGYVKYLKSPFNGQQNFPFYLWSRGIRYHTTQVSLKPIQTSDQAFLQRCRRSFYTALTTQDEHLSEIWRAILMGKKECLSKEQLQHFFYTGTMHLFAVSGLHVGFVSSFIFFLCRWAFLPRFLQLFITGIGVCFYAFVVGFTPSTLRATLMVIFVLVAQIFSRPVDGKGALYNTIGLTLIWNPFELWDVGFQLSYGTVASILCVGLPLARRLTFKRSRWYNALRETCFVSFCASAMSCVFSIYYWGIFSPWVFLANLFLIPFAGVVVVLGFLNWILYCVLPILLPITEQLSQWALYFLVKSVEIIEKFPGTFCDIPMSNTVFHISLLLFLFLIIVLEEISIKGQFSSADQNIS